VLSPGDNKTFPRDGDTVTISFILKLKDGTELENTFERHQKPLTFTLGEENEDIAIKGVEMSIRKMSEGEDAMIHVPSRFAFGPAGWGNDIDDHLHTVKIQKIPPNADLDCNLQLYRVEKPIFTTKVILVIMTILASLLGVTCLLCNASARRALCSWLRSWRKAEQGTSSGVTTAVTGFARDRGQHIALQELS